MSDRNYTVHCGLGRINVLVRTATIELRGEREAVAQAAWFNLLGKNELVEDVAKPVTRKFIMDLLLSTYEPYQHRIYDQFKEKIKFTWIGVVRHG